MSLNNKHCAGPRTQKGRVYLKSLQHRRRALARWDQAVPRDVGVGWVPITELQDGFTALTPLAAISAPVPMGFVQLLTGRQR